MPCKCLLSVRLSDGVRNGEAAEAPKTVRTHPQSFWYTNTLSVPMWPSTESQTAGWHHEPSGPSETVTDVHSCKWLVFYGGDDSPVSPHHADAFISLRIRPDRCPFPPRCRLVCCCQVCELFNCKWSTTKDGFLPHGLQSSGTEVHVYGFSRRQIHGLMNKLCTRVCTVCVGLCVGECRIV